MFGEHPAGEHPTANAWATGIPRGFLQKCHLGGALLGQSAWRPPKPTGESSRELARAPWKGSQLLQTLHPFQGSAFWG